MEAFLAFALSLLVASPADGGELLQRFAALPEAKQAALREEVEAAIQAIETPLGQFVERILDRDDAPKGALEIWKGHRWYDPKIYAPGLPIARKALSADDPKLAVACAKFLKNRVPYDLEGRVRYFWDSNKILSLDGKENHRRALENCLAGYPPRADLAREIVLSLLDEDPKMDALAEYFGHSYTDRDGGVYPGITIFDVWDSGHEIEMPDVDAIPFARHILKDHSFQSPIPAGAKRTGLYRKIGEQFTPLRRYVALRQAIASYFFAESPPVSPLVEPMRDRIHFLIVWNGFDPFVVGQFVKAHPERESFLQAADELMQDLGADSWSWLEARKQSLRADHRAIREATARTLERLLNENQESR